MENMIISEKTFLEISSKLESSKSKLLLGCEKMSKSKAMEDNSIETIRHGKNIEFSQRAANEIIPMLAEITRDASVDYDKNVESFINENNEESIKMVA